MVEVEYDRVLRCEEKMVPLEHLVLPSLLNDNVEAKIHNPSTALLHSLPSLTVLRLLFSTGKDEGDGNVWLWIVSVEG